MKIKRITFILGCSILLCACGTNTVETEDVQNISNEIIEESIEQEELSDALVEESNISEKDDINGYVYADYDKYASDSKEELLGDAIYVEGVLSRVVTYTDGVIMSIISNDNSKSWGILVIKDDIDTKIFDDLLNQNVQVIGEYYGYKYLTEWDEEMPVIQSYTSELSYIYNLTSKEAVKKITKDPYVSSSKDFLADKNFQEEYEEMRKRGEYQKIYDLVTEYLENTDDIEENDTAYKIKDTLDPIIDILKDVNIEYDKVEGYATFTYKDVNVINSSTHIVPRYSTNNPEIEFEFGFIESNWIFFEDIVISCDGESKNFYANNEKIEEVLSGGKVKETQKFDYYNLKKEIIDSIYNSDEVIIRFKKDEKKYDYTLSDREKEACFEMAKFYWITNDLSDIAYSYKNNKEFKSWKRM